MGRKAGLKQIMEVETMKKLFKRGLAMAFCLLCLALGQVQAFDFMADVDEVSRDPWKAYTLYLRMPWWDYLNNFDKAPGWSSRRSTGVSIYYVKKESINSSVKEAVEGFGSDTKELSANRIAFFTDSIDLADRIFERLSNNIEDSLGKPYFVNTNFDNDSLFKIYEKAWKRKVEAGKTDYLTIQVRYGNEKRKWAVGDSQLMTKCTVWLWRIRWSDTSGPPFDSLF